MIFGGVRTINCASGNIICSAVISGASGGITKTGTEKLILSAANTYAGATTINDGTFQIGNAGSTGSLSSSSAITVTSPGILAFYRNTGNLTQGTGFAANISGTGKLQHYGSSDLNLNSNNTFSGGIEIYDSGNVTALTDDGAMGTGTITLGTGVVKFNINARTLTNNIVINSGTQGGTGNGLIGNTGTTIATLNGTITINGAPVAGGMFAGNSTGKLVINGAITSSVPVTCRIGSIDISGGGSYTDLYIGQGTVRLTATNGIATGATITIASSAAAALDLGGYNQTCVGVIKGGATATIGNSSTASNSILTTTGTYTYAGIIQDVISTGDKKVSLVINGGVATLSGICSYTGTTSVTAGTLFITGSLNIGSAVDVSGVLGGTGNVYGPITVNNGGTINPGSGGTSIGTLGTAAVTFSATSACSVDLNGTVPIFDKINSSATVALGAELNSLTVASITNSATGKVYTIVGAASVTGTWNGKAEGSTFTVSGRLLRINYTLTNVLLTDVTPERNHAQCTGCGRGIMRQTI